MAFVDAMETLQAEEDLRSISTQALATGHMSRANRDHTLQNLRRRALGRVRAQPATRQRLEAMGIGVSHAR